MPRACARRVRRIDRNPLGSAAGYGTPGLPVVREATRARLGFAEVQEPVTAVQLSRGKAEAQLLFEITLLLQDLGRLAADLLLFYTREFGYVELPAGAHDRLFDHAAEAQSRRPRADPRPLRDRPRLPRRSARRSPRLPSGYHRDLQLIKAPLFRGIDIATQVLGLVPVVLEGLAFRPERIRLDEDIHATARANSLAVEQGLPFREAYRITAKTS